MTPDSVTILDWGASHFAGAVFRRTRKSSLKLEAWACEELMPSMGNDPQARIEAEAAIWQRIRRRLGGTRRVALSLPSPPVSVTQLSVAMLDRANTLRSLEFEGRQALGKGAEERSRVYLRTGASKGKDDWVMASIDRTEIDRCTNLIERVGFVVDAVVPQVSALHTLLQGSAKEGIALALAQIGATATRFLHVENGRKTVRILPVGGNTLTRILADELSLSIVDAERLKRSLCHDGATHVSESPTIQRSESTRGEMSGSDEIGEAFRRSRDIFTDRLQLELTRAIVNQRQPAGVVPSMEICLLGGGACVPELCPELSRKLRVVVRNCDPAAKFEGSESVQLPRGIDVGRCGELAAVARVMLFEAPGGLNLLGVSMTHAAALSRRQPLMLGIAAMAAVALVPPMISFRTSAVAVGRRAGEFEDEVHALDRNRARIAGNLKAIEKAGAEIARWRSFSAARSNWVRFFAELQAQLSSAGDMWLDRLQPLTGAGMPSPSLGARMVMTGRVLEQPSEASPSSAEMRVRSFLEAMSASPFVASFEQERFDRSREGILGFEVVLRMNRSETL